MRAGHAILSFAVLAGCALRAAEFPIEFSGVLTAEGKPRVALTDKSSQTTRWLEPGDNFLGYTIARYDAKEDTVFLRRHGQEYRLTLIPSRTVDAQPAAAPTPAAPPARDFRPTAIRNNLRQFVTAARRFQTEHGAASVSFADIVGPGKLIQELTPVAGENYSTLTYAPGVTALSVTTSDGNTVTFDIAAPPAAIGALPASPSATRVPATTGPASAPTPSAASDASAASDTTPAIPPATDPAVPAPPPSPDTSATPPTPAAPQIPDAGDALAPTGTAHTVKPGDTLASIARARGMTVEQLQGLNPGLNASSLQPGQTIRIR